MEEQRNKNRVINYKFINIIITHICKVELQLWMWWEMINVNELPTVIENFDLQLKQGL